MRLRQLSLLRQRRLLLNRKTPIQWIGVYSYCYLGLVLHRLQEYIIGHHLRRADNVFEQARIITMYRFSWMFMLLFLLPFVSDIVLGYKKLTILHGIDFVVIGAFPLLMRQVKEFNTSVIVFFIISTASSFAIVPMANPMKLDIIGMCWVLFFAAFSALMLRGFTRILFSLILPWIPVIYVLINIRLNGALTIDWLHEKESADPPLLLAIVPVSLLLYAMWSHTSTVDRARKTITTQKSEIENKNKDITDSINYARHLQDALLPELTAVRAQFPGTEIVYRPKAIVAGDFYWTGKTGSKNFIAAADCTGHGVPGAMVSVVCSGALTRSIGEFGLTDTAMILNKTRELVIETFGKNNASINDGMDISLLCIDRSTAEITWSGANNPLWICNGKEMQIIKADKQPVGASAVESGFTMHSIDAHTGSVIYLFTDGLADQFGGPDGKKLRHKTIVEFLVQNHHLPLNERMKKLDKMFLDWKGDLEQVDDVCIIGLTV